MSNRSTLSARHAKRRFDHGREDWSVSQNHRGRFLPLLLGRLAKAHTWPATVLVDEPDARGLAGLLVLLTACIAFIAADQETEAEADLHARGIAERHDQGKRAQEVEWDEPRGNEAW